MWRSIYLGGTYNNTITVVFTDDERAVTIVYSNQGTLIQMSIEMIEE